MLDQFSFIPYSSIPYDNYLQSLINMNAISQISARPTPENKNYTLLHKHKYLKLK